MSEKQINYPFTLAKIKDLKVGDTVSLAGKLYTGRDRLHKYLFEGGKSPVDLKDGAIFHCGPIMVRKEGVWVLRSLGPTTSVRHEPYMPRIIDKYRVRVIIGKGGMDTETRKACSRYGCVYLQLVGGTAGLIASRIESVDAVHFLKEFGPAEALWELTANDLTAMVTMDVHGRSLHKKVKTASKRALKEILNGKSKNGVKKRSSKSRRSSAKVGKKRKK